MAFAHDSLLTIERIFDSRELNGEIAPRVYWNENGTGYYALEDPQDGGGKDLVWHDPETGGKEILVPAHAFIPPGESDPLTVEGWQFSRDGSKLLLFTASKRVWRHRGERNHPKRRAGRN